MTGRKPSLHIIYHDGRKHRIEAMTRSEARAALKKTLNLKTLRPRARVNVTLAASS